MANHQRPESNGKNGNPAQGQVSPPTISLPKGGGAIRGVGEKFATNPVTGTGSMIVPIATSPGRSGFGPQLSLSYDSGAGNGPFGFGWSLAIPAITRKTEKGLPQYLDGDKSQSDSDVFTLSGAEDLVPVLQPDGSRFEDNITAPGYTIHRYRPRTEGLFARIERWTKVDNPTDIHWRSLSRDNILTLYGQDGNSRIADDPIKPTRIFSWLICETRDDKGNAIIYEYKPEDGAEVDLTQAHERNRGDFDDPRRTTNRYLKRVYYGNRTPLLDIAGRRPSFLTVLPALQRENVGWMFEVVFDYGEHNNHTPHPDDHGTWQRRNDPFSTYRAGFEVRTYRLCQRVLMFHYIPDLPTGEKGYDGLVYSTDFTYSYETAPNDVRNPIYSFLRSVTQSGYQRQDNGYLKRSLPPIEFDYSQPVVQDTVQEVDAESLENLPLGLDGAIYQWTDLHGEGIPGILTEQAEAWFYKRNLSPINIKLRNDTPQVEAKFAPIELVTAKPNLTLTGGAQFMDLDGDGQPDLVTLDGSMPGLYEHDDDEGWQIFHPFTARLNRDIRDPNLKLVDLDGDGHADILITEDSAFIWYPSLAEEGFGPARRVHQALDEEKGPRLVFADGTQSTYLADMSGDGLTDVVRICNGEVCYWPNLGYGRFGAKVTMDNPPWFDAPDQFDHQRIRLADIDGSGTTDIIYLHREGVRLYFNQSGNSWSKPHVLNIFPQVDNLVSLVPTDLLGNGTACLVWSSPLPGDSQQPMRYVDLMGGQKPHLLVKTVNNLGAETTVTYAPSTKFYLADKRDGRPWLTKLPFPVHVVETVTVTDTWRKTHFSSTYSYHHGYFDGEEREFRGFGCVEQVDVESYDKFLQGNIESPYITPDKTLYQPPVKTITWYHTGAWLDRERILKHYPDEYFPAWFEALQPDMQVFGDFYEYQLPEPDLTDQYLSGPEWHEALRACKGMPLRQEIYELDMDALERGEQRRVKLFSATDHTCDIQRLQPKGANQHAVFLVTESEAITYHYELDLRPATLRPDPRIAHTLNLRIDEYGYIQQAITVGYPRWQDVTLNDSLLGADTKALIAGVQSELHLAYVETHYTNDIPDLAQAEPDNYRLRLPCEVQTYELTGITPTQAGDGRYFSLTQLREFQLSERYQTTGQAVEKLPYHALPNQTTPQQRLIEHTRVLFFNDTLDGPLPPGRLNGHALPYETYTLALTSDLLIAIFADKLTAEVLTALDDPQTSGYLSGQGAHNRLGPDTAGQYWRCSGVAGFNVDAPHHFFLPERYTDPFGNATLLNYDPYDLFVRSSTDALDNRTEVMAFDYRVLAPRQLKDINNNLSEMRFDALGMPAVMAVTGKNGQGDTLAGFDGVALNPDQTTLARFFVTDEYNQIQAQNLLGSATTRYLYYFGEVIENDQVSWGQHPACAAGIAREQHAAQQPNSPVQTTFEYSDGGGSVLVRKIQAEPALPNGPLRWVASGKTILNNKGKPVKQYEPYFSPPGVGHRFEEPQEVGVTVVLYYDAVGRLLRTELPDGSYRRVDFSPWHVTSYDANDTVGEAGNAWFARMNASIIPAERRAAQRAAQHADTPSMTLLDSLGREVITIVHNRTNGVDEKYVTFTKLDAEGKPLWVQDARGNRVMQYVVPPLPAGSHPFNDPQNLESQGVAPGYDIAGNLLFQHSMDGGDRWLVNDAASKPLFAWNSRGFRTRDCYDALHRPTHLFVHAAGDTTLSGAPRNADLPPDPEVLIEKRIYGEQHPDANTNLRGQMFRLYDSAGVATSVRYDFKGNLLTSDRRFARDYNSIPNWSALATLTDLDQIANAAESLLEPTPPLIAQTTYDALNRPTAVTTPDGSIYYPDYNPANLLERVTVKLRGAETSTTFVTNIDYNAKGQRERITYDNGVTTDYNYDPLTFRLIGLQTTRPATPDATATMLFKSATVVQDLHYIYDPVGNITQIEDGALRTTVQTSTACDYTYDALYRLIAASGREHSGQTDFAFNPPDSNRRDEPFVGHRVHPNDLQGLRSYVESYRYDAVGNILQLVHQTGSNIEQPGQTIWQRRYQYALDSNRMLATSLPGDPANLPDYTTAPGYIARYRYDAHGNIITLPHLPGMRWDFKDQLSVSAQQVVNNGTPETTYYVYDAAGQRARKVTERQNGARKNERLYLGNFEIYREYNGNGQTVTLERETLHVMDDKSRIGLVETKTIENQLPIPSPQSLLRYQLGNHLGSASVELDSAGALIGYEEYHPYGTTAFQAGRSATEVSLKRYRYTGKERDEETGFTYHGARYYAPWLGRWVSCDPIGIDDGVNIYAYVIGNPLSKIDPSGASDKEPSFFEKVKIVTDESQKAAADRLRAFNALVKHPIDTAGNLASAIKERYMINRAGVLGDTPALAAVKTVDQVLDPLSHAARHESVAQLADSRGQTEVALRARTQELFSLGDAALMLESMAKKKPTGGSVIDDATVLREDPSISKSGTPRPKDQVSVSDGKGPEIGGASKKTAPEILKQIASALGRKEAVDLETIQDMVRASGYEIPDEINFIARDPGKGKWASYAPARGDIITWESYKIEGKVNVSIDPALLKSPGMAMQKMVHELHELAGLKAKLQATGGMTEEAVSALTDQLHQEALLQEKQAMKRWGQVSNNGKL